MINHDRDELIEQHTEYARALCFQIAASLPPRVDRDELLGFAMVGLVEAAERFDPSRRVAFTTFSYYYIRGAVFDGIAKMTWLPPALRSRISEQTGQNSLAEDRLGRMESRDDPAVLTSLFRQAVAELGAVHLLSAEALNSAAGSTDADEPRVERDETGARLRMMIDRLESPMDAILRKHYMEQKPMSVIAEELNCNKSTVSRQHARAIAILREAMATADQPA